MTDNELKERLVLIDDVLRKNYALTELVAQTFSAFVVATDNKAAIADFIKSTNVSDPLMEVAHAHAKSALLTILDSVKLTK
ncbi:hypothetical protein [Pseudescherichia vulneris]|uniref:hypothetical protein n=1 Tax=Pseudescherichia vulneris TaxID=566 RepID=UPI003017A766